GWGHKVAGSAGSFGYNDMTAVGRLIEQLDEAGRGPLLAGLLSRLLKSVRDALEALEAEGPETGSTG
ncbi:MAG TPA: Hpt domain-containing protein, partial [Bacteroidetes bacterium]|nr:Hpt domain-containing protein [Bacteroidota bacterium]